MVAVAVLPPRSVKSVAREIDAMTWTQRLIALAFLSATVALSLVAWSRPLMSPDSWTLYELGQWIWHGDTVTGLRQYRVATAFPISHPFLFPILAGGVDWIFAAGFRSGLILNGVVTLCLPWFIYIMIQPVSSSSRAAVTIALTTAIGLLLNWFFLDEILAGRTMPIAACLMALALRYFLVSTRAANAGSAAKLGIALGFLVFTRFDALPFCMVLVLGLGLSTGPARTRILSMTIASVVFVVTFSPYLVYSLWCCGTFFASETSGIVSLALPTHPTTYWPFPPTNMFDAPVEWSGRILRSTLEAGRALIVAIAISPIALLLFVPAFFQPRSREKVNFGWATTVAVFALASMALGPIFLSFPSARYFVVPATLISALLGARFARMPFEYFRSPPVRNAVLAAAGMVGIVTCIYGWARSPAILPNSTVEAAMACDQGLGVLVYGERGPEIAARGKIYTLIEPDNWDDLTPSQRGQFYRTYRTDLGFDPDTERCEHLRREEAEGITQR